MTNAAIYTRLSQDRDGTKGGTDRQEKDCRALAKREGLKVAEVFVDDDRSAYSGKPRPEFDRMMSQLDRFDVVIYWKTDRLVRRTAQFFRVLEACQAHHVRLVSVVDPIDTSTPIGQGVAGLLASVGEQESHNTGRRVARASEDRAQAGRPHGHRRAYGFAKDGETIIDAEARVIREGADRMLRGEPMHSIVTDWNRRGIGATNGGPWVVTTFRQMMVSPRIAGVRVHRGEAVGRGTWKPIITEADHERILAVLANNGGNGHRRPRTALYLLSGLLTCGRCGAVLHSAYRSDGSGDRRYMCHKAPGREACGGLTIAAQAVDDLMEKAVLHRLASPAVARALRAKPKRGGPSTKTLHALEAQLVQLGLDHDAGIITRAEWLARRGPIAERIEAARAELVSDVGTGPLVQFVGADVPERWGHLSIDERRGIVAALVESIAVAPATRRGPGLDPKRVDPKWIV
jgi:DNA invertase Pin-like site-specific DNA recombinase